MKRILEIVKTIYKLNWKKKVLYLFFFIFLVFFVCLAMAPLNKIREFNKLVKSDTVFLEKYDSMYFHSEMKMLVQEKAYKEALLKLAESDSIQLIINLSDSTVNLSIKGVVIHRTKVGSLEVDKIFKKMPVIQQARFFSEPLEIHSQYATIIKEPIVVRHAPKDTVEAAQNVWQPDTLIQNPAFLIFTVEHDFHFIFEQEENNGSDDKREKFHFYNRLRMQNSMLALRHFVLFEKQEYHPKIVLKMPADDLRAIYRALPTKAYIVIKL